MQGVDASTASPAHAKRALCRCSHPPGTAQHQVTASREELVRLLGLDEMTQALKLRNVYPILQANTGSTRRLARSLPGTRGHPLARTALDEAFKEPKEPGAGDQLHRYPDSPGVATRHLTMQGTHSTARGWKSMRLPRDWGGMQLPWVTLERWQPPITEGTVRSRPAAIEPIGTAWRRCVKWFRCAKVIAEGRTSFGGAHADQQLGCWPTRDQVSAVTAALDAQQFWLAGTPAGIRDRTPHNTTLSVTALATRVLVTDAETIAASREIFKFAGIAGGAVTSAVSHVSPWRPCVRHSRPARTPRALMPNSDGGTTR